jgi:BASS family bile acid:Na+ symporter
MNGMDESMNALLAATSRMATIAFAVTSMSAVGLGNRFRDIVHPLRQVRLLLRVLVANFVLVPILGFVVARMVGLAQPAEAGLMLIAMGAGAPFLIKLTEHAGHDVALSATLLVVLLPASIISMPWTIPWVLPEARLNPAAIAIPLLMTMLLPLALGLAIREVFADLADRVQPIMRSVSSVLLIVLIAATLLANATEVVNLFGTGAILAAMLVIGGAFVIGHALGGRDPDRRGVLALATAQRNVAAATVIAAQDFADPGVLVTVITTALVSLGMLFVASWLLRSRAVRRRWASP